MTPASSECWQLCSPSPELVQLDKPLSFPAHCTSSIKIGNSAASPNLAPGTVSASAQLRENSLNLCQSINPMLHLPSGENPSCLHTTDASVASHWSSQTVPNDPPKQTSTSPSYLVLPPLRCTSPYVHAGLSASHNRSKEKVLHYTVYIQDHTSLLAQGLQEYQMSTKYYESRPMLEHINYYSLKKQDAR